MYALRCSIIKPSFDNKFKYNHIYEEINELKHMVAIDHKLAQSTRRLSLLTAVLGNHDDKLSYEAAQFASIDRSDFRSYLADSLTSAINSKDRVHLLNMHIVDNIITALRNDPHTMHYYNDGDIQVKLTGSRPIRLALSKIKKPRYYRRLYRDIKLYGKYSDTDITILVNPEYNPIVHNIINNAIIDVIRSTIFPLLSTIDTFLIDAFNNKVELKGGISEHFGSRINVEFSEYTSSILDGGNKIRVGDPHITVYKELNIRDDTIGSNIRLCKLTVGFPKFYLSDDCAFTPFASMLDISLPYHDDYRLRPKYEQTKNMIPRTIHNFDC